MKIGEWTIEPDGTNWRAKRLVSKPGKRKKYQYKYWPRLRQAIMRCAEMSLADTVAQREARELCGRLDHLQQVISDALSERGTDRSAGDPPLPTTHIQVN